MTLPLFIEMLNTAVFLSKRICITKNASYHLNMLIPSKIAGIQRVETRDTIRIHPSHYARIMRLTPAH